MTGEETPNSDARATLLRALDHLDEIEEKHGAAKRVYLVVAYAHQIDGSTVRGWASTDDPAFATVGLLREVANAIDDGCFSTSTDDDEPGTD